MTLANDDDADEDRAEEEADDEEPDEGQSDRDDEEVIEFSPDDPWDEEDLARGGCHVVDHHGHHGWQRADGVCEFASSQFDDEED